MQNNKTMKGKCKPNPLVECPSCKVKKNHTHPCILGCDNGMVEQIVADKFTEIMGKMVKSIDDAAIKELEKNPGRDENPSRIGFGKLAITFKKP